jgi:hypothetical protein
MINGISVYCINLDSRKDKWKLSVEEARKIGVNLIRYPAIWKNIGHDGCRATHLALLEEAKGEGVVMVTEDDFRIIVDNPIEIVQKAYSQLPDDWDMFYLGATLNVPLEQYSDNLFRLKRAWATHAFFYNNQNGVMDYILENHNTDKFSVFLHDDVQEKFNCFITYPMVATQRAGRSDILRKRVSYKVIEERYAKYVKNK